MAPVKHPSAAEQMRRIMLKEYASKAGKASQASGRGHRWTADDAKRWGRLGGQCARDNKKVSADEARR